MASATYALSVCSSSSPSCFKVKTLQYSLSSRFSQLGMCHFTPWNGLRYADTSVSAKPQKLGRREKCRGKVVYASLFGVGAPEALVIGAVALMVFGPKGLAEVARNLGKTLREFQPTIKELQEVSKEFKNALEREISLDDVSAERNTNEPSRSDVTSTQSVSSLNDAQITSTADTNGAPLKNTNSSDQHTNVTEEQLDAATQEDATSLPPESQIEIESQPQDDALPVNGHSSEDNLKITEEHVQVATSAEQDVASPQESLTELESQPQGVSQEAVVAEPVVQKPESET